MELRIRNIFSNLLVFLLNSLFGDVEKFISRAEFFLRTFSMIFSPNRDEEVLQSMPCKGKAQERVSVAEVNAMMSKLGMAYGLEGTNEDSSFGLEDLVGLFEEEEPSFDEIKEAFCVFDVNNDGFIDARELHSIVSNFKGKCDLEECKRMIKTFDSDGDGLIDFQEFVKFMEKCLF